MQIAKHIKELDINGITFIPNAISKKKCSYYTEVFENLIEKLQEKKIPLNATCQTIENPFRHDFELADLIYNKKVDNILKKLIDKNYVLINTNIINRIYKKFKYKKKERLGRDWHHDSRIVGNKKLEKGIFYLVIIMFNDFTKKNASTLYIPKSHTRKDQPKRKFNYKSKQLLGKAGTIAIFDAGLWHRAGKVSNSNRWSMYSYYGPWFIKPYYRFTDMLGLRFLQHLKKFKKKTKNNILRLLHYHSTPPKNEMERRYTLTKDPHVIKTEKRLKSN